MPLRQFVAAKTASRKALPVALTSLGVMTLGAMFAPAAQAARFTFSQTGYQSDFGPINQQLLGLNVAEISSSQASGFFEFDDTALDDGRVSLNELNAFSYKFTLVAPDESAQPDIILQGAALEVDEKEDQTDFTAGKDDLGFFNFQTKGENYFLSLGSVSLAAINGSGVDSVNFDFSMNNFRGSRGDFFFSDKPFYYDLDQSGLTTSALNVSLSSNSPIIIQEANAAVPTPAMLPGLLGMGVAAWRKRRAASTQQFDEQS